MTHELSTASGRVEMAYAGQVPWHGLGQRIAGIVTTTQAMKAAGLEWTVSKKPLAVPLPVGEPPKARGPIATLMGNLRQAFSPPRPVPATSIPFTQASAIIRDDLWLRGQHDQALLGTAGSSYVPLQNHEAFSIVEPVIHSRRGDFESAGALGKGERVWILVRLDHEIRAAASDPIQMYVLLSNSHDGATGIEVKLTPVRVVLHNTLAMALAIGPRLSIPHDRDARAMLGVASEMLLAIRARCNMLERFFQSMARVQIGVEALEAYLLRVFPDPLDWDDEAGRIEAKKTRRLAAMLFESGTGNRLEGVVGSLWAALNAVTELLDHRRGQNQEERLQSLWWGEGYLAKLRAVAAANAILVRGTGGFTKPAERPVASDQPVALARR